MGDGVSCCGISYVQLAGDRDWKGRPYCRSHCFGIAILVLMI